MVIIRLCLKTEWYKLQVLNDEVFRDNAQYDPDIIEDWALSSLGEQYFKNLLNNTKSCCFVADDTGVLVGYIAGNPKEFSYRKSKYFEIGSMGVSPNYRSQGIGSQLIAAFSTWAIAEGYEKLFVNAYFKNSPAINFYKNNGFTEIDVSLEKELHTK